jgi:hypothetical protein
VAGWVLNREPGAHLRKRTVALLSTGWPRDLSSAGYVPSAEVSKRSRIRPDLKRFKKAGLRKQTEAASVQIAGRSMPALNTARKEAYAISANAKVRVTYRKQKANANACGHEVKKRISCSQK